MFTIVDIVVAADGLPLGDLPAATDAAEVELQRVVPVGPSASPYVWVTGGDVDEVEAAVRADPAVEAVDRLAASGDRHLYQVRWADDRDGLLGALVDADGELLRAVGTDGEWNLRLQFRSRGDLRAFRTGATEAGVSFDLRRLFNPSLPQEDDPLTAEQRAALRTAYEQGYYQVPRRRTQREVADLVGISGSSLSRRLRRGTAALIEHYLYPSDPDG